MSDVYAAPPRPRISPAFAESLRAALGARDFSKGERASLQELLTSLRSQATHEGYPSMPPLDGDDAELLKLKRERLDGVWALWSERPASLSDVERELLPRLLPEACHGFRPHAGHTRAVPTHVVEARRENAERAAALASAGEHALAERVTGLESKLDGLADNLAAVLALLSPPTPSAPPLALDALPSETSGDTSALDSPGKHKRR